jgi:L-iditol 2-dehydrogenase
MKAALKTAEGRFEIADVDEPALPGADWVKVRIHVAGICGTDLRHWQKHEPDLECHIMGHELAGVATEVGEGVTNVAPGDRVVVETVMGDGRCEYCRVQRYNVCPHLYDVRTRYVSRAYAEYLVGPASKMYKLPDHVSFEEAALIDTFSVSMHALQLSGIKVNDRVVVIGGGPIGLAQLQLAKLSGADVVLIDVVDNALEKAREMGADLVLHSGRDDIQGSVLAFTGGRGADIAFECTGGDAMPETLPLATQVVRRGAQVVVVGGFDAGVTSIALEWQRIQMSEIQLIPSASFAFWGLDPEQGMVLELLGKGRIDARSFITHRFPLDRINEAFETADAKEETGAVFVAVQI